MLRSFPAPGGKDSDFQRTPHILGDQNGVNIIKYFPAQAWVGGGGGGVFTLTGACLLNFKCSQAAGNRKNCSKPP